jgi:hypothetical protein
MYSLEVRVTGETFNAELISPKEVAGFIIAFEKLISSIVIRNNAALSLTENDVILGLSSITQGSLNNSFVTIYEAEVDSASAIAADAITNERYDLLPIESIESIKEIIRFNRKHNTSTEVWRKNGGHDRLAVITPTTRVQIENFTVRGTTSLYGTLRRIGGDDPPRAWMRWTNGETLSCRVKSRSLASQMAQFLYQTMGVRGTAFWDNRDMRLYDFRIEQLLPYREKDLSKAVDALGDVAGRYYQEIADLDTYLADIRGNN